MSKIIITILLSISITFLFAQADVGIGIVTFTAHPFADTDLTQYSKSIDQSGYLTFEPGVAADINIPVHKRVRFGVGIKAISDRFSGLTASANIHATFKVLKHWKHRLHIGGGPSIYLYQDRELADNYEGDEKYNLNNGSMPYRIVPFTLSVEYSYAINKNTWFTTSLCQPHPVSVGLAIGLRFIIPAGGGKGCDCPSYR